MAQPAPTARQCTAALTGVMIRHGIPLTGSLTADLTAVVVSREAALLEYLAARARTRVEQVLVHSLRAEAFRDGLNNAATWLSHAATAAARRAEDATTLQRALQRARQPGPAATVTHGTSRTLLDGGAQSVDGVG
jgi:hypothetical protein